MRTAFERGGDVRSVDLAAAFATLWRERASGVLEITRPEETVRFDVADGEVVGLSSSNPAFETAEVLARAGKLDLVVLEGRRLPAGIDRARAAREQGLVTERDLRWGEKIRAVEILADLVGWLEGFYSFDRDAIAEPTDFRIGIHRLLLELFLRSRDRAFVHHSLPAPDAPLRRAEDFEDKFPTLGLTPDALAVVAAIDGRSTAAQISRRAPPDPFSVEKLLAALATLGLVHPEYAAEEPPPPRPAEAPIPPTPREPPVAARPPLREPEAPPPTAREEPPPLPDEPEIELPLHALREPSEPMDQPLEVPEAPELLPSRRPRLSPAWLVVVLAAGVGAVLLLRFRGREAVPPPVAAATPARVPAAAATAVAPSPASTISVPPTPAPPTEPPLTATSAPVHPTAAPVAVAAAPPAPGSRDDWLALAQRDRRLARRDRRARFTIQLELVCELPSLEEAWVHQRRGAMWLLTSEHRGRTCFRVLWGRYASLAAARRAKDSVPRFFFTPTNLPAVVSTGALLH